MTTLLDTLTKGTSYLEAKGVDSPRLTMELLVAHVLQKKRMELYLAFDRPLKDEELDVLRLLLKQRGQRIPLQHLIGEVDFFGRLFKCDKRALIPRPETEELIEHVLKLQLPETLRVLDLCSGSGIIGITLKAELGERADVVLADLSPATLSLAKENAERLGVDVELIQSDLFDGLEGAFDLIVSNPPYVSTNEALEAELSHDPSLALYAGADGMSVLNRLVPDSLGHLSAGGWLAMEIGYDQSEKVRSLLASQGYQNIELLEDIEKIPRFPIARKG